MFIPVAESAVTFVSVVSQLLLIFYQKISKEINIIISKVQLLLLGFFIPFTVLHT